MLVVIRNEFAIVGFWQRLREAEWSKTFGDKELADSIQVIY